MVIWSMIQKQIQCAILIHTEPQSKDSLKTVLPRTFSPTATKISLRGWTKIMVKPISLTKDHTRAVRTALMTLQPPGPTIIGPYSEEVFMTILNIPITKAGRKIEIETDALPEAMYAMALEEGLKAILNRGMTKIVTKDLEGDDLTAAKEAAYLKAEENKAKLMAGDVKRGRASSATTKDGKKVDRAVLTEARRLAKNVVRDELKKAKVVLRTVPASKITEIANELIANDPQYIAQAETNLKERATVIPAIDLSSFVATAADPKLVAKVAAERKDKTLSATQAGKVKPRKSAVQANV